MASQKSTPIIIAGGVIFVIGAALAFALLRDNSNKASAKTSAPAVTTTTLGPGGVSVGATSAYVPPVFNFVIPPGKNAVAVSVPFIPGLGGFAKAGDLVNIYANISKGKIPGNVTPPESKLVISNVPVLEVLTAAPAAGTPTAATYLLALDPGQAEQVIFFQTYESLYFALVPNNAPPAVTSGRGYQNAA